ncbi:MAG: hypothetical protein ABI596_12755 [Pyrinomonadaceae bacterium]
MLALHTVQEPNNDVISELPEGRAALVIAHPGHELRIYQWLRLARPSVFVLTDGSGHAGNSRLDSTSKILEDLQAVAGCIYGRLTDRAIYASLMAHEFEPVLSLTGELATALVNERVDYVVGDAMEGHNPAHDLCRFMINGAIQIASGIRDRQIANFDVLLTSEPRDHGPETLNGAVWLELDSRTVAKKIEAAFGYPELTAEVHGIIEKNGTHSIGMECLRPASGGLVAEQLSAPPFYECYGEQQVAAGHYQSVLRYREHVLPLAQAIQNYAAAYGQKAACAY